MVEGGLLLTIRVLTAQNFQKAKDRLEELKRGGGRKQKARVSRATITKQQGEGECVVM